MYLLTSISFNNLMDMINRVKDNAIENIGHHVFDEKHE